MAKNSSHEACANIPDVIHQAILNPHLEKETKENNKNREKNKKIRS